MATKKKTGRPKIEINKEYFENLCGLQCTEEDIAHFFDCSVDTINNWCKSTYKKTFSEVYKKNSTAGKISLRRYQFALAKKNASMAIFLGKQYLGQKDVVEQKTDVKLDDGFVEALNQTAKTDWSVEDVQMETD